MTPTPVRDRCAELRRLIHARLAGEPLTATSVALAIAVDGLATALTQANPMAAETVLANIADELGIS